MRLIVLFLFAVLICAERGAHAYGDPGSGTLIWQILLAASFGFMFYLRRIIVWARGLGSKQKGLYASESSEEDTADCPKVD
jgi:hypothetical protein